MSKHHKSKKNWNNNDIEKMGQQNPVNSKQGSASGNMPQKGQAGSQQQGQKPHQAQAGSNKPQMGGNQNQAGKKPEVSGSHDIKKMSTHDHQHQSRGCSGSECKDKNMKGGCGC